MYSVKRGQICAFYACNPHLMLQIAEKAYNFNPDQPYLKAMYAFALGEVFFFILNNHLLNLNFANF